jgi:hypothetical protein
VTARKSSNASSNADVPGRTDPDHPERVDADHPAAPDEGLLEQLDDLLAVRV